MPAAEVVQTVGPRIPVSVSALIFDRKGRLLLLKPTYKSGWTLPGGVMEPSGETPWEGCRREVREECGLQVTSGRLVCVDFRRPKPGRPGGVRILFHCGMLDGAALADITLQETEISEHRFVALQEALPMLRTAVRDRVTSAFAAGTAVYLEQGRPVDGVG